MASKEQLETQLRDANVALDAQKQSNDVLRRRIKELERTAAEAQAQAQEAMARLHAELQHMHSDCGTLRLFVAGLKHAEAEALAPVKSTG